VSLSLMYGEAREAGPSPAERIKLFEKAKGATGGRSRPPKLRVCCWQVPLSLRRDGLEWSHYKELFESGLGERQNSIVDRAIVAGQVRDLQREIRRRKVGRAAP